VLAGGTSRRLTSLMAVLGLRVADVGLAWPLTEGRPGTYMTFRNDPEPGDAGLMASHDRPARMIADLVAGDTTGQIASTDTPATISDN
jgi:hypothetical protein